MTKKQQLINKINSFEEKYFNEDQKIIAIKILENVPEEEAQAIADFIFMKRKTGFAFDYSPEVAKGRLITLIEDKNKRINIADEVQDDENKLIIGDNYNALKALILTHKNKINVIYIDPPYNTESAMNDGNQSSKENQESAKFIYKDKFGRGGWLNMMKSRLALAKDLLTEDGLIFVSIDDSEQAYLKVLMDDIFGEENTVASIIVQKKSGGGQAASYYKGHDYLFCYSKNIKLTKKFFLSHDLPQFKKIIIDKKNYGYFPDSLRKMHGKFNRSKLKPGELEHRNVFFEDYKITFNVKKQLEIEEKIKNKEYLLIPYKFKNINVNMICKAANWEDMESKKLAYSIITAWTTEGQQLLDSIFMWKETDKDYFKAPKPLSLLINILKYNLPKNGIVLDFFAGSGTTGQAVLELNKKDKGNRRFILCTNNEDQIAEKITFERLYRVIKGMDTKSQKNFNWLKLNKPYTNTKLRVINIDDSVKISLDENVDDSIYENAKNGLHLLQSGYLKKDLDLFYDLAALNPLKNDNDKF